MNKSIKNTAVGLVVGLTALSVGVVGANTLADDSPNTRSTTESVSVLYPYEVKGRDYTPDPVFRSYEDVHPSADPTPSPDADKPSKGPSAAPTAPSQREEKTPAPTAPATPAPAKPTAPSQSDGVTISTYAHCDNNITHTQGCIDAGSLTYYTGLVNGSTVRFLAGHDYMGYAWLASVKPGTRVTVTGGAAAGTYEVVGNHWHPAQGGPIPGAVAGYGLVLQSCQGDGTGFSLLRRVG